MATILFEICDADYYDDYVGDGGGDDKDNALCRSCNGESELGIFHF